MRREFIWGGAAIDSGQRMDPKHNPPRSGINSEAMIKTIRKLVLVKSRMETAVNDQTTEDHNIEDLQRTMKSMAASSSKKKTQKMAAFIQ